MNMQKMMKELQKMQSKMGRVQAEMESTVFEAEAGGGLVKIGMNGKFQIQSIKIAPEVVDPDDIEALEDLLMAALNAAHEKVDAETQDKMGGLTKGMGLPGL